MSDLNLSGVKASVIIPTRNRQDRLVKLLACLKRQTVAATDYEIIVVDDGSTPHVVFPSDDQGPKCTLVRLEGVERSAARNRGALVAEGKTLVFVDDDITVESDFLAAHLRAHDEWPGSIAVGASRLAEDLFTNPFGRFRQELEQNEVPRDRGPVDMRNFCAAANMSIGRDLFHKLEGFDQAIVSGEDQDLALRHTVIGGRIVFLPEAVSIHHDTALDIQNYCRRSEWGSENMVAFCRRHPDWPDNIERERVNGFARWGSEPLSQSARKTIKLGLASRATLIVLFASARLLERVAPKSYLLNRIYRLLLGAHILRGYRKGLKRTAVRDQLPAVARAEIRTPN
jgi:GT2 family glycosyltransferase